MSELSEIFRMRRWWRWAGRGGRTTGGAAAFTGGAAGGHGGALRRGPQGARTESVAYQLGVAVGTLGQIIAMFIKMSFYIVAALFLFLAMVMGYVDRNSRGS